MNKIQPPHFELVLTINNLEVNDIQHFTIFRCPIKHTSSYVICRVNIKTVTYLELEDDIRNSIHPNIKMDLFLPDTKDTDERNTGKRVDHFCTKFYKIIQISPNENLKEDEPYISCTLMLVNPILHFLNSVNGFNKLFFDISGKDIFNEFESYLKSLFGDKIFNFLKVNYDLNVNEFKYNQIIIKCDNDLLIPSYIIDKLKPFNSYSYGFFDDFRIDEFNTGDICSYIINLGSKDGFTKRDISDAKYSEILAGLQPKEIYNVNDMFNKLDKISSLPLNNYINTENVIESVKKEDGNSIDIIKPDITEINEISLEGDRKIKGIFSNYDITASNENIGEYFSGYAPDELKNITERYEVSKKLLCNDIQSIERFYIGNSYFDFFQFDCIYNMQLANSSSYCYIPLSIVNSFERTESEKTGLVNFNSDILFMKFKDESL